MAQFIEYLDYAPDLTEAGEVLDGFLLNGAVYGTVRHPAVLRDSWAILAYFPAEGVDGQALPAGCRLVSLPEAILPLLTKAPVPE